MIFLQFSCSKKDELVAAGYSTMEFLQTKEVPMKYKYGILVLPGSSCGSCISRSLYYISEDITKMENMYIVFTNHNGLKGYRLTNDVRIFDHKNFINDGRSELYNLTKRIHSPTAIIVQQNKVEKVIELTLSNIDFEFPEFLKSL